MAPHHQPTPPHSQPSQHMNSQGGGGGHPAPSPVQHPVGPGHPPPPQQAGQQVHTHPAAGQGHPASSGTPQPHLIYQQQHAVQMSQQGHPPLQPSPHTPTSPQTIYPQTFVASPYYATNQTPGMPQQQQNQQQQPPGGGPQMSFTHTQPHTTVTHAHHQQHSHIPHHGGGNATQAPAQIVMMPQHPHQSHQQVGAAGQIQHPQHPQLQHTHQIPHHMAGVYLHLYKLLFLKSSLYSFRVMLKFANYKLDVQNLQ